MNSLLFVLLFVQQFYHMSISNPTVQYSFNSLLLMS